MRRPPDMDSHSNADQWSICFRLRLFLMGDTDMTSELDGGGKVVRT